MDATPGPADAPDPESYSLARDVLNGQRGFAPVFSSEHRALRISIKLFNKTPADLPLDLKQQLLSWLDSAPAAVEGAIRPGCVFVTVQLLVSEAVAVAANTDPGGAVRSLLAHLLAYSPTSSSSGGRTARSSTFPTQGVQNGFWASGTFSLQLACSVVMVRDGKVTSHMTVNAHPPQQQQQQVQQPQQKPEEPQQPRLQQQRHYKRQQQQQQETLQKPNMTDTETTTESLPASTSERQSHTRSAAYPSVTRVFPAVLLAGAATLVVVEGVALDGGDVEVVLRWGGKCVKRKLAVSWCS